MNLKTSFGALFITVISSVVLILLGLSYFALTLWIVKSASAWIFPNVVDTNYAVLSAAIIVVGTMLAGRKQ